MTESEVAVAGNGKFRFVGADAFSPDELRAPICSAMTGTVMSTAWRSMPPLLEKTPGSAVAEHLREAEGWE